MISSTIPSAKYSCSGSPLMFWNGRTAMEGLSGSGSGLWPSAADLAPAVNWRCRDPRCIEPHRPVDVFQRPFPEIVERKTGLVPDLLKGAAGQAHAAGLAFILDARCYIDAVAKNVITIEDDVADIDADAERNLLRGAAIAFSHFALHVHRAGHRIDGTGEFHQHAIASRLDDPTVVFGNRGIDEFATVLLESFQRADLVGPHQARVAGDISRQHCRQSSFDTLAAQDDASHRSIQP